jgi:hypothetical protein
MRRITQVLVVAAALAALPAGADVQRERSQAPIPGSDRDPFSQTYTGRDSANEARAEREREQKKASPCECACGHKGAAQEHPNA